MSYTALLEMKFPDDKVEQVKEALVRLLPESRQFEGCDAMTAHQSTDDPTVMVLVQRWASKEAHAKYMAFRGGLAKAGPNDTATVMGNLAEPPSLRRFDDVAT